MPATLKELRRRLNEERERLNKALEQQKASAPPMGEAREGSPYGKKEEGASETVELETRLALEKGSSDLLREVEHALQKMDDGTYGVCDACRQPIGAERLESRPQANLCIACKGRQAKNAKSKFPPR